MQSFTRSATIAAPAQRVFAALTDLDNASAYMPDIVKVRLLTDGGVRVGTRWKETRQFKVLGFLPLRASAEIEVTELQPDRCFATVADDGCNWASYRFELTSAGQDTTQVALLGQFKCTGKYEGHERRAKKMADWCEKTDGAILDRLKAFVEGA